MSLSSLYISSGAGKSATFGGKSATRGNLPEKLPFADNEFNLIWCHGVITLPCFRNKIPEILEDMSRVAKQVIIRIHPRMLDYHGYNNILEMVPNCKSLIYFDENDLVFQ